MNSAQSPQKTDARRSSYGSILKSSSLIGGSEAFNYSIGLLRTKVVAVLLGPSGVGLIGIYNSIISLAGTASELGLRNSGVREISSAIGASDPERVAQVTLAIRRLAILLGIFAAVLLALAAPAVSRSIFGDVENAVPISLLSVILVFNGINHSQKAAIQGNRRIKELAKVSIISALASTIIAIISYGIWGASAIAPVLIMISAVTVGASAHYARKLYRTPNDTAWKRSIELWRKLVSLGLAVAWGAFLAMLVPFFVKAMIVREMGVDANGLYMAAWVISGLFVQFIIKAMSADFFPRLSAVSEDREEVNCLVNEQTEIGVLIALPGVLAATIFAPLMIQILYSSEFMLAADLMPWFLIGVLGKVVSWPMGMIVLAKGHSKTFALMQSLSAPIHIAVVVVCFNTFGLVGAAMGFGLHNIFYNLAMRVFLGWRYDFRWSHETELVLLYALVFFLLQSWLAVQLGETYVYWILACICLFLAALYGLRGLVMRTAESPKMRRCLAHFPSFVRRLLNANDSNS